MKYLALYGKPDLTVLTSSLEQMPSHVESLLAPQGSLKWERLSTDVHDALKETPWDEIIILHNGGNDYGSIYQLVSRVSRTAPVTVFYHDLSIKCYASIGNLLWKERARKVQAWIRRRLDILPDLFSSTSPPSMTVPDISLDRLRLDCRVSACLARAAATSGTRIMVPSNPITWEFSGFSQNGEDGIIDYLTRHLKHENRYFIEIGSADGLENNTAWLAWARRYSGLMIEGDPNLACRAMMIEYWVGVRVEIIPWLITVENIGGLKELSLVTNPDVFSIDIDGNDYHVTQTILASGFRPKIFVVEYNATFGPISRVSVPYCPDRNVMDTSSAELYFGASIGAWIHLFTSHEYRFITVDSNGVNAFFVDSAEFDSSFLDEIRGLEFADNFYQTKIHRVEWKKRFDSIQDRELIILGV